MTLRSRSPGDFSGGPSCANSRHRRWASRKAPGYEGEAAIGTSWNQRLLFIANIFTVLLCLLQLYISIHWTKDHAQIVLCHQSSWFCHLILSWKTTHSHEINLFSASSVKIYWRSQMSPISKPMAVLGIPTLHLGGLQPWIVHDHAWPLFENELVGNLLHVHGVKMHKCALNTMWHWVYDMLFKNV